MRVVRKADWRRVLPAVAAAAVGWVGVSFARASFNLEWNAGLTVGNYSIWTLTAQNDGTAGQQQQPQGFLTGTGLLALDLTISTPGSFTSTVGAMLIDLNADIDGDDNGNGLHQQADADVTGQPDLSYGTQTPRFRSALGTFIGYNTHKPYTGATTTTTALEGNEVYVNSQTYANFTQPAVGGGTTSAQGTPAIYETSQTPDGLTSELDPAFLNGTVHSLEVIIQLPQNDTVAHPIANLVIGNGILPAAIALLTPTANPSNTETYTILPGEQNGPSIYLTSNSTAFPSAGTINLSGGNGIYGAREISVPNTAQLAGELTVTGFNPPGDKEIYVLAVDSSGSLATTDLSLIISQLQAAITTGENGSGPVDATVTTFASLPASIQGLFTPNTYNIAITFPTGNDASGFATSPDSLVWNFGRFFVGYITVTNVGVVPEPGSVGVLLLGGIGLMGRRRRRRIGRRRT
jgi:hypothetical protein